MLNYQRVASSLQATTLSGCPRKNAVWRSLLRELRSFTLGLLTWRRGVYCSTGKAAICIALVAKYSSFAGICFCLVVSNTFYFPFHIWDVILPIDFHIFQRGRYTTNQFLMRSILRHWNQCICGMLHIFGSGCGSQTWTYTQVHMVVLCEWFQKMFLWCVLGILWKQSQSNIWRYNWY